MNRESVRLNYKFILLYAFVDQMYFYVRLVMLSGKSCCINKKGKREKE